MTQADLCLDTPGEIVSRLLECRAVLGIGTKGNNWQSPPPHSRRTAAGSSHRGREDDSIVSSFRLFIARGRSPIGGVIWRLEHACPWCLDGEVMSSHSMLDRLVNRPTRPFRHGDQLLSTCISKHGEAVKLSTGKWPAGDGPRGSYWPATSMHSIGTKQTGFEPSYRWPTCTFPATAIAMASSCT